MIERGSHDDLSHSSADPSVANSVAVVQGTPLTEFPEDLYIPSDGLKVFLDSFEGPLDLLLYLIKRKNIDILDIPVAEITEQYVRYIDLMEELELDLVGEYLVMAAMLAEIKSQMLLPRDLNELEEEEDPRGELVRHLQEYERYKTMSEKLEVQTIYERDVFAVRVELPEYSRQKRYPDVSLDSLLQAIAGIQKQAMISMPYHIAREQLSVRERMVIVLDKLSSKTFTDLGGLITAEEGHAGVIVVFLAILELSKNVMVEIIQNHVDEPIYVKAVAAQCPSN